MEIIVILVWVLLCFLVGGLANKRGRSGAGWWFLSVCCSPFLTVIVLVLLPDLAEREREEQEKRDAQEREEQEKRDAQEREQEERDAQVAVRRRKAEQRAREAAKIIGADLVISLEQLRRLKDQGVYTDIEFAARKDKLIFELKKRFFVEPPEAFLGALLPLLASGTLTQEELQRIKSVVLKECG